PLLNSHASPTAKAPPTLASKPTGVTPPERPASTTCHVVMSRGTCRERRPSSVAHVSAPAAARPPIKPAELPTAMHSVAAPPLARHCQASRRAPLACISIPHLGSLERALELRKNASSVAAAGIPPRANVSVPTVAAASAPCPVNSLLWYASVATHPPRQLATTQRATLKARRAAAAPRPAPQAARARAPRLASGRGAEQATSRARPRPARRTCRQVAPTRRAPDRHNISCRHSAPLASPDLRTSPSARRPAC